MSKLHQRRPQTATNHVSATFMRSKEFIGRPIPRKETKGKNRDKPRNPTRNRKKPGKHDGTERQKTRETRNLTRNSQKHPGNDDGTKCQKSRETSSGTLWGTRRNQEMMMEHNARRVGRHTRNQKIMMEQRQFRGRIENPVQLQSCLGHKPQSSLQTGRHIMVYHQFQQNWPPHPAPAVLPSPH